MIYSGLFILHSAYMILGTCDPLEHILNQGNERCWLTVIDNIPHVLHADPCPRQAQGHSVQRPDFLFIQIYFKDSVQVFIYFPSPSFAFIVLSTFGMICLFAHLCAASSEVSVSWWHDVQLRGDKASVSALKLRQKQDNVKYLFQKSHSCQSVNTHFN